MGLELIKATVINIYKTLAITGYPLSWPSKLIMSTTQHPLFCTLGPSGSPCGEGSAPAVTTPRALRQVPTPGVVAEGAGSCTLFSGQLDSHNKGRFRETNGLDPQTQSRALIWGMWSFPGFKSLEDGLRSPLTAPSTCPQHVVSAPG